MNTLLSGILGKMIRARCFFSGVAQTPGSARQVLSLLWQPPPKTMQAQILRCAGKPPSPKAPLPKPPFGTNSLPPPPPSPWWQHPPMEVRCTYGFKLKDSGSNFRSHSVTGLRRTLSNGILWDLVIWTVCMCVCICVCVCVFEKAGLGRGEECSCSSGESHGIECSWQDWALTEPRKTRTRTSLQVTSRVDSAVKKKWRYTQQTENIAHLQGAICCSIFVVVVLFVPF